MARQVLLSRRGRVVVGIGVVALLSVIAVPLIQEWSGVKKSQNASDLQATGAILSVAEPRADDPAPEWNVTADSLQSLDQDFAEFEEKAKSAWDKLPGDQTP